MQNRQMEFYAGLSELKGQMPEVKPEQHGTPSVLCPYCGEPAQLVDGAVIYPHRPDLADLNFWQCAPCDAFVGCHKPNPRFGYDGTQPLGRLANARLRRLKSAAHRVFDPLWRDKRHFKSRNKAYNWLANHMGLNVSECHIGMFDEVECLEVVRHCGTLTEGDF